MPIHQSHPNHELTLTNKKRYMCDGCKMDGNGERYRCNNQLCNYDLHKECMNPAKTLTLASFPGRTFKFLDRAPPGRSGSCGPTYCGRCRACDICGMTIQGFVYHCKEEDLDVHPVCAMLKREITAKGVVFELRNGVIGKCNCCKRKELKGAVKDVPGFSYVSRCKEFSFHVYCLMGMGIEHGSLEVENMDRRLRRNGPGHGTGTSKVVKVVKLFLKIVLSVLFGDPTAILASVAVNGLSMIVSVGN